MQKHGFIHPVQVKMYDLVGRIIFEGYYENQSVISLEAGNVPDGIYTVIIIDAVTNYTEKKKVVKQGRR